MALNFGLLDTDLPGKIAGSYYAGQQQRQQNELAAQQAAMRQQELGMRQQEFGMRQQEAAQLAQERQTKLQRATENQKLLDNLYVEMEKHGHKPDRPTLGQMLKVGLQTNQSELVQIATKGLQALDEQEQFEGEMARIAPMPAAPAAANALAPAAQPATAAPTNALAGGYSRPQIESMLRSSNPRMREMGGKLLGALPKETADPADLVMMRQLGYPQTQAGYQAYRDAQRQERLLSPEELKQKLQIAATGAAKTMMNVNTQLPASEEAQKEFMREMRQTYGALKQAPTVLSNIEDAKKLIPEAKGFMGAGGESILKAASFLNNRLGTNIDTKGVQSAEELRSRLFLGIMDNLKKLDSQPSQQQQAALQQALGSIGTDPGALPRVLDVFGDTIRQKVDLYNEEAASAEGRGVKFPYKPTITLPNRPAVVDGKTGGPAVAPKKISSDAEYNALPSGTTFVGPDGRTRRKP